jgi:hypothetical protein
MTIISKKHSKSLNVNSSGKVFLGKSNREAFLKSLLKKRSANKEKREGKD